MGFIPEITCRRCGNKYSAIHSRCPSCGAPRKQPAAAPVVRHDHAHAPLVRGVGADAREVGLADVDLRRAARVVCVRVVLGDEHLDHRPDDEEHRHDDRRHEQAVRPLDFCELHMLSFP